MAADDLSAPLGQNKKPRRPIPVTVPQAIVGALGLFAGIFVLWAAVADNPFGGEPMVVVHADLRAPANAPAKKAEVVRPPVTDDGGIPGRYDGPAQSPASAPQGPPPGSKTVNIIDGKSGSSQVVVIAGPADGKDAAASLTPIEQKFVETTKHGAIPKIADDGVHPSEAYAQAVTPIPGKPDAPRVAIIVGGLGVSANATAEAIGKLPGAVTLGFAPYGADLDRVVAHARGLGHEILLQVPMEPFDYPDNDPGPQTLLTSQSADQNIDRLHWLMSRFHGYVGIINTMGARFTASDQAFAPVLRETAKRGLIFVDDGSYAAQPRRSDRRRQQTSIRQSRCGARCRADTGRGRPRAVAAGNGGARARRRRRLRLRAAGRDRPHRQMGEGSAELRRAAGADHRRRGEVEAELNAGLTTTCPIARVSACMVLNRAGLAFVGRRIGGPEHVDATHSWQMPQGGIDPGEDPWPAALRELREETNIRSVERLAEIPDWLNYDIPRDIAGLAWKGRYRGQTQKWFAMRFTGDEREIDVAHPDGGHEPEFAAWRWEPMRNLPDLVVPFKRPVYERVVREFGRLAGT